MWAETFRRLLVRNILLALGFSLIVTVALPLIQRQQPGPARGPLAGMAENLDRSIALVNETGEESILHFRLFKNPGMIVIAPPGFDIRDEPSLPEALRKKMHAKIKSKDTGHLFCVLDANISDHRPLNGLAGPVYGMGKAEDISFKLSRRMTTGRPVRMEIV